MSCDYDGELLPNTEDCRKYFKCANGAPSKQVCPGTLIFDTELTICNWPQSTSCNIKPKPVELDADDLLFFLSEDGPTAATAKPTTERNKEKFESLFHTKDRDFTRLRDRHKNLRDRMRERARKEEEEEKSTQRSREPNIRKGYKAEDEDDTTMRAMSFGSRGSIHDKAFNQKAVRTSSVRNRGSNLRDDESDDTSIDTSSFRNRGSNFRNQDDDDSKIDTSSFRNRGSSFQDEEDDDTSSFRNRGSSGSRNRGDLDDKLTARENLKAKLKNKFSIDLSEKAPKKTRKILEPIICEHDNKLMHTLKTVVNISNVPMVFQASKAARQT